MTIVPGESSLLWCDVLDLYLGQHENKLWFFTPEGQLVPTPMEAAWQVSQQAEAEQQRAECLAAQLRSLGVEPE